jgi:hypothetical protein
MRLLIILFSILVFVSCHQQEDLIPESKSESIKVRLSGMGVDKVPISNGRTTAVPSDQKNITFIRKHNDVYNYISYVTQEPIQSTHEVKLELPSNPEVPDIHWIDNHILMFTNLKNVSTPYGGDPPTINPIDWDYHQRLYYSWIELKDNQTEYDVSMKPLFYDLVFKSNTNIDVDYLIVDLMLDYNNETYYNIDDFNRNYNAGAPEEISIKLLKNNDFFESEKITNFFGEFRITKISYYNSDDIVIKSAEPDFKYEADKGKRYIVTLPNLYNTIVNINFSDVEIKNLSINLENSDLVQMPDQFIEQNFYLASEKIKSMINQINDPTKPPRTIENGNLVTTSVGSWTSGFFAGNIWMMYEYTGDYEWLNLAKQWTAPLEENKNKTSTHDLGFMLYNSFGRGYLPTNKDEVYHSTLITAANRLVNRFDPDVGMIRSWDWGDWIYPVIIDNMMNLELLLWAAENTKNNDSDVYYDIAISHADKTLQHHFRNDWSSYHVVDFNPSNGNVIIKETYQGYADESAWARGQAWALYGYTMMYKHTLLDRYLDAANNIAEFILNHPNMPDDYVPYWDFNAPDIPNAKRDASSAAIIASALFDLSKYNSSYSNIAVEILTNISQPNYKDVTANHNFILNHSVGSIPSNKEVDVPLVYADYYYLEALLKYKSTL